MGDLSGDGTGDGCSPESTEGYTGATLTGGGYSLEGVFPGDGNGSGGVTSTSLNFGDGAFD